MKKNRVGIIYKNTIVTLFTQVLQILFGFALRKLFIDKLGVEYLGYNSVFTNLLQMLNMADLGIGVAITSFLYTPIAKNDTERIGALMYMYKKIYHVLGILVAALGGIMMCFLPLLIPDAACSYGYLRLLFFINLLGTVSTYFLAYKRTLVIAYQRSYEAAIVDTIMYFVVSVGQLFVLLYLPNYVIYLVLQIAKGIIANYILSVRCDKSFAIPTAPSKDLIAEYKKPVFQYVKDLLVSKVGAYVFYGTDNVIISVIKGSLLTGYLSNYTLVTTQVQNVVNAVLGSVQATLGNYIRSEEDTQKHSKIVDTYLFANYFIGNFCMLCIIFLIRPFVKVLFGADYALDTSIGVLLGVNILLNVLLQLPSQLFVIYRLYKYDKPIIIVSASLNIVISVVLVFYIGIVGALFGTFVTSLIYLLSRFYIVAKKVLNIPFSHYIKNLVIYACGTILTTVLIMEVCTILPEPATWYTFFIRASVVGIMAIFIPLIIYFPREELQTVALKFLPGKVRLYWPKGKQKKKIDIVSRITIVILISLTLILSGINYYQDMQYKEKMEKLSAANECLYSSSEVQEKWCHISIDDFIIGFKEISQKQVKSIFDCDSFKILKQLHEVYGTKFSLYCYYSDGDSFDLSNVPSCYANEFQENSDWLKFGFHAYDENSDYDLIGETEAQENYEQFVAEMLRICGNDLNCLTRTVRLSSFKGSEKVINALHNSTYGIQVLLTADDDRGSYALSREEELKASTGVKIDGVIYLKTDLRLENSSDVRTDFDDLVEAGDKEIIVFTHEWCLQQMYYEGIISQLCETVLEDGYLFSELTEVPFGEG